MNEFAKFTPYAMKTTDIRITSYDDMVPRGSLSNPYFGEEEMPFVGLTQMLLHIQEVLDGLDYPQRSVEPRSFTPADEWRPALSTWAMERGKALAIFQVTIHFRQNASWQGSVLWLNRGQSAYFRSVLELVMLMDSALSAQGGPKAGGKPKDSEGKDTCYREKADHA